MTRRALIGILLTVIVGIAPSAAQVETVRRADGSVLIRGKGQPRSNAQLKDPAQELLEKIDYHAREAGLEPKLVQSVIQAESAFDRYAVSRKGAQGLMQLMPATARQLGVKDPFDIDQNLEGGTRYLRKMIDRYDGDLVLTLAAYNAGPEAVARYEGVPPYRETRNYIRHVLNLYRGEAPVIPTSGMLRGRPAYLVRKDGRWLVTSDSKAVDQAERIRPATEAASPTGAAG